MGVNNVSIVNVVSVRKNPKSKIVQQGFDGFVLEFTHI